MSKLTTHQRKARDLMQREDWDGALSELQRVLGLDANNPTLHNQIGDVYLRKGAVEQACDHFEMAVDLYSNVSLHNNAVALCRKVVRLAPNRVEVRYHLARLRMDQGLRSDATAAFVDYLEHAHPDDDAAADALERRCVEVVESFPDLAPVGQIVEKLETVKRPQGAYKIVQRAAQRATDSGDAAAAARLTEKMRSLRVLLEGQGETPEPPNATVDPSAVERSADVPDIDLSAVGDPAAVRQEKPKASIDPGAIDLPAEPSSVDSQPAAGASAVDSQATAAEGEKHIPEIDLDAAGALDDVVADLQGVADPGASRGHQPTSAVPTDDEASSVDESMMPEYELPETSLEEVASLLEQAGVEPPGDPVVSEPEAALLMPESESATEALSETDPMPGDAVPLIEPEAVEPEIGLQQPAPGNVANAAEDEPAGDVASIADTFAEPPTPGADVSAANETAASAAGAVDAPDVEDSRMIPEMDPDDRPASVVYEPAPESRRSSASDEMRREPVWIPSPNTVSLDPTPAEEGQTQELEEVIDTFREQMARALGDDGAARYDLGVAYYEMGLYNEALAEFEVAVKCPGLSIRTLEMMSSCLAQQGRHDEIVSLLDEPLSDTAETSPEDRLSLQYAMGLALEAVGQQDDARRHFEEVALVDIGFKDVQSRLQR